MIEAISNWAGELVVALIVTTLIEMLLPDNKTKKYVKTLIGVYIVFCIISPFIDESKVLSFENIEKELESYSKELKIDDIQTTDGQNSSVSMENLYIEEFRKNVIEQVENQGYKVKKCNVDIEIDATKENAGINKIYVNISKRQIQNGDEKQIQNAGEKQNTSEIKIDEVQKVEISINSTANEDNNSEIGQENEDTLIVKKLLCEHYEISEDRVKVTQD